VMDNNLSTTPVLVNMLENDLDGLNIGICMDVGHAHMLGDTAEAVEIASEYLITTHVHDNRRQKDDHLVPFEGSVNWGATIMELEKIGYDGVLMYEVRNTDSPRSVLERCMRARKKLEALGVSWDLEAGSFS
jgi:sugar phosphate isomerase/epimerase